MYGKVRVEYMREADSVRFRRELEPVSVGVKAPRQAAVKNLYGVFVVPV
jgi:hypothetical protein